MKEENIKVTVSKEMKAAMDRAIRLGFFRNERDLLSEAILDKLRKIGIKPSESEQTVMK